MDSQPWGVTGYLLVVEARRAIVWGVQRTVYQNCIINILCLCCRAAAAHHAHGSDRRRRGSGKWRAVIRVPLLHRVLVNDLSPSVIVYFSPGYVVNVYEPFIPL